MGVSVGAVCILCDVSISLSPSLSLCSAYTLCACATLKSQSLWSDVSPALRNIAQGSILLPVCITGAEYSDDLVAQTKRNNPSATAQLRWNKDKSPSFPLRSRKPTSILDSDKQRLSQRPPLEDIPLKHGLHSRTASFSSCIPIQKPKGLSYTQTRCFIPYCNPLFMHAHITEFPMKVEVFVLPSFLYIQHTLSLLSAN